MGRNRLKLIGVWKLDWVLGFFGKERCLAAEAMGEIKEVGIYISHCSKFIAFEQ